MTKTNALIIKLLYTKTDIHNHVSLRLHGGNTKKLSAEALEHIFWYECMVGNWDSDLSIDRLILALKVVVTNAADLITKLKNTHGKIFSKVFFT